MRRRSINETEPERNPKRKRFIEPGTELRKHFRRRPFGMGRWKERAQGGGERRRRR